MVIGLTRCNMGSMRPEGELDLAGQRPVVIGLTSCNEGGMRPSIPHDQPWKPAGLLGGD